ncbi:DUF2079 domain-containing protein [Candidatus Gottesmanbacteria bacterium]|nr:DUF2079 domain-containing protein [Candidatus Gottesmanbacteria bacterium]
MRLPLKILLVWIIVLTILYSTLSIVRHNHFQSGGFDLGIYDQAVWQYSRLQWPYNTIKARFILGDHLTLTLPLLAPLFWLWEDVRILLVFQAFWLSLSAFAVYKIVELRWQRYSVQWAALAISIIYSVFPGIQYAIFFDFHPVVIGVGLLLWIAYFLEAGRKKLLRCAIVLLILTQENMGLALAGLGAIYFFQRAHRKAATLFIIVGIVSSLIAVKMIAAMSPSGFEYQPVFSNSIVGFITQLFDNPEKQQSWFSSFAWFSFLPFLSPGAFFAVLLDLSQYFATGPVFVRMWSPFAHHRAILAPFLILGLLDALHYLIGVPSNRKKSGKWIGIIAVVLFCSALMQQYLFHYPLNKIAKAEYWLEEQWMRDNRELLRQVPVDATAASQQSLVPHLSHRKEMYLIYPVEHDYDDKRCGQAKCWWLDFAGQPEYLIVDLHPGQWLTQLLETNEHFGEAVANMEKTKSITLVRNIGSARLYRILKK